MDVILLAQHASRGFQTEGYCSIFFLPEDNPVLREKEAGRSHAGEKHPHLAGHCNQSAAPVGARSSSDMGFD